MRYLTLLNVTTQPATPPPPSLMEQIMKLGEEATKAGALIDTAGLLPSHAGARVQLTKGELSTTDGPFTEAKELVSYAIYEVRSKEEAMEWCTRFMRLHRDHWEGWEGEGIVLKIMGPEDFSPPA